MQILMQTWLYEKLYCKILNYFSDFHEISAKIFTDENIWLKIENQYTEIMYSLFYYFMYIFAYYLPLKIQRNSTIQCDKDN